MLPYFTQQPPPPEALLELKCRELIFNIFSSPENAGILSYLTSVRDLSKPLLSEVMEANYTYNLSLKEFARISQRSLTAFKNEFNKTFNTTPGKWLVQKGCNMLRCFYLFPKKTLMKLFTRQVSKVQRILAGYLN